MRYLDQPAADGGPEFGGEARFTPARYRIDDPYSGPAHTGALEDLRQRLDRLPASHPSSSEYSETSAQHRLAGPRDADLRGNDSGHDLTRQREAAGDVAAGQDAAQGSRGDGSAAAVRQEISQFERQKAGLPDVSLDGARTYVESSWARRPWLEAVRTRSAEVQRFFAALDQGGGHAHQRHEGYPGDTMTER